MNMQLVHHLFALDSFTVSAFSDPTVDAVGYPADSDDMLTFATPILGPTSCLIWHRLARYVTVTGEQTFEPPVFAATFGVMPAVAAKAIGRLIHFGIVRFTPTGIAIRTTVPPFPQSWRNRLPDYLAGSYPTAA